MPLNQLMDTRSRWSILSKVDQLGAIDFWTLTISLDALSPEDTVGLSVDDLQIQRDTIFNYVEYERRKKVLILAAHEYTHFVDATSSLWGMRHLSYIDSCHNVDIGNETQFYFLKHTYDYMRSIRLPDYYTTINLKLPTQRPWRSNITCGVIFSSDGRVTDRPIIFVNFLTADENLIVRSPLSVVSLLEASAMAKEIEVHLQLIAHLQEPEKTVETRLLKEELLSYIYNPEITEYSACFHLLANLQDEKDIGIVARAVGILCRIVLNAPEIAFKTATKNITAYAEQMKLHKDSFEVARIKSALEKQNRGALYFLVAVLLPKSALKSHTHFISSLEISLKSIGLSIEKLKRGAYQEAEDLWKGLSTSKLQSIRSLAECGYENFKKVFPTDLEYSLEQLALPPALHGDDNMTPYLFSTSERNTLRAFDLENAYDELVNCQLKAESFAEACI
ncbi:MAG TPA: hypothetical protein VIO56_01105 [Methylotenera sp.]|jgi:hypothetical protein